MPTDANTDTNSTETKKPRRKREGGGYFSVSISQADKAVALGLEAALAFLVMARGTVRDGLTTSWSAHAIEKRRILGRHAAARAVHALESAGLCTTPAKETRSSRKLATRIVEEGARPDEPRPRVPTAWLPNTLVDGHGERRPPLAMLREARSADALRLLLHIYAANDLATYGGIPPEMLRHNWTLTEVARRGEYRIFGVGGGKMRASPSFAAPFLLDRSVPVKARGEQDDWRRFWAALDLLIDLQLLVYTGFIFDGPFAEGEAVFAFYGGTGGEEEFVKRIQTAGTDLLHRPFANEHAQEAAAKGFDLVVPVLRHIQPHAIGIYRPRYLADNEATRRWLAQIERWRTTSDFLPVR